MSLLIQLISAATGYPFDVVDQALLLVAKHHGDRLQIVLPEGHTRDGTCINRAGRTIPTEEE